MEGADLLDRLAGVFARVGYEGASLAMLAEASGLRKASLYHRFPGGKAEMAAAVLGADLDRLEASVLAPMRAPGPVKARIAAAVQALDSHFDGGRKPSLLNMLAAPEPGGPLGSAIREGFAALAGGFAALARDAGCRPKKAQRRAERMVMLLQGALVITRGTGDTAPFRIALAQLEAELV